MAEEKKPPPAYVAFVALDNEFQVVQKAAFYGAISPWEYAARESALCVLGAAILSNSK